MINPILLITDKCDVHADFVTLELRKIGGDIVRMNTRDLACNSNFALGKWELTEPWQLKFHFQDSDKIVTSESFDTIWYRKPESVEPDSSITEEHANVFVKEEYSYFLRSFYNMYSHKRWINPFWNLRHASQKLPNLELAVKLGLKIPKTLITNNPEIAREFGKHCIPLLSL